ncbi:MAG: tetratricopeptide repeat protein [Acidobacteria bacterium]|nr:tetratricopeptide repeat protein [Acidobacteriota bacterium]
MKKSRFLQIAGLLLTIVGGAFFVAAQNGDCADRDYECRIRYNRELIRNNPNDEEAYYNLGLALQKNQQYAEAVEAYTQYVAFNIKNKEYLSDGYRNRGNCKVQLGQLDAAIDDFNKSIRLYQNAGAYFGRGRAFMGQKNYDSCIADFTRSIDLEPENVEANYNRAVCYYRSRQYEQAIEDLDRYISVGNASDEYLADGYEERGLSYFYLGRTAPAIDDFTRAIELVPYRASGYKYRAMAYRKIGKTSAAEADEKKAAELDGQ